jgi:hypothetical protein
LGGPPEDPSPHAGAALPPHYPRAALRRLWRTGADPAGSFRSVLDEENEDRIITVTLEHPSGGIILCLFAAPPQAQAMADFSPVSLAVASASELNRWKDHFAALGIEHTEPRNGYLVVCLVID